MSKVVRLFGSDGNIHKLQIVITYLIYYHMIYLAQNKHIGREKNTCCFHFLRFNGGRQNKKTLKRFYAHESLLSSSSFEALVFFLIIWTILFFFIWSQWPEWMGIWWRQTYGSNSRKLGLILVFFCVFLAVANGGDLSSKSTSHVWSMITTTTTTATTHHTSESSTGRQRARMCVR